MADINQDDIDKLLQGALGDLDGSGTPAAGSGNESENQGPASQDDIDALFAAGPGAIAAAPAPAPAAPPAPPTPPPNLDGIASQDDIDALFATVGGGDAPAAEPAPEASPAAPPAPPPPTQTPPPAPDPDLDGIAGQDDIDALFAAGGSVAEPAAPPQPEPVPDAAPAAPPPPPEPAAMAADGTGDAAADPASSGAAIDAAVPPVPDESVGDIDMDALLREISEAAPPPPPPRPAVSAPFDDTVLLDMDSPDIVKMMAEVSPPEAEPPPAPPPPPPAAPPPPVAPAPQFPPLPAQSAAGGTRQEFSVLQGAGEVEAVASQINGLLGAMAEKAHRYMQAWIAADGEAKELRARALGEERRRTSLESERGALAAQVGELRQKLADLEGAKLASDESARTLETSYQAKIREMESRVSLLHSESESLKDELTRARNQATGIDIESRRIRFEADRLKGEVESERMERLRIQRALENREKELQAVQAQASGQASSLFIDELHRLVRRLESELDVRSSGAHDALRQLDRLEVGEDMVPVAANVRAALMQALGRDDDQADALRSLGREAAGVKGPTAIAGEKTDVVSFETALATFNLEGAMTIAGSLLHSANATAALLMRKVYLCPALRRPDITDHLPDMSRLLEGLRTVQEASDRSRGKETAESEVFYVQMFDYLHNMVRLKVVTRLSGDIWRLFLDLRGRFSFITSDKQWNEYRDGALNDRNRK